MFKSFDLPWVDPYDVEYVGRGRYNVDCIFVRGCFFHNIVELKG
jgi:hypothetical protein